MLGVIARLTNHHSHKASDTASKVLGSWLDEKHWFLNRKYQLQEISWSSHWGGLRLMWSFLRFCVFMVQSFIQWTQLLVICLQFWQDYSPTPGKRTSNLNMIISLGSQIFNTQFLNSTKHESFREAATFLCSKKGSWAWQTLETNPVAKAEKLKVASM